MTDIIAKPFDWNDNLSKEAIEDFEGIQKDLPYCTCQNIGMALAKLELLEKQGCKVIEPSGSSSEKPRLIDPAYEKMLNKWIGAEVLDKIRAEIDEQYDRVHLYDISCAEGLEMALNIVDKCIAEEGKA